MYFPRPSNPTAVGETEHMRLLWLMQRAGETNIFNYISVGNTVTKLVQLALNREGPWLGPDLPAKRSDHHMMVRKRQGGRVRRQGESLCPDGSGARGNKMQFTH